MKKISRFFTTVTVKFKRLSSLLKYSVSFFCTFGLMAALCGLPLSAVVIDGQEYEEVTITQQDIINLFNTGDITCSFSFTSQNHTTNMTTIYQMKNHLYINPTLPYYVDDQEFYLTTVGNDKVMFYSQFVLKQSPIYQYATNVAFNLTLPWDCYITGQNFKYWFFLSGSPSNVYTSFLGYLGDTQVYGGGGSAAPSSVFWSDVDSLTTYYSIYNWLPDNKVLNSSSDGIKSLMSYSSRTFSPNTEYVHIDSIKLSLSYANVTTDTVNYAPVAMVLQTGFTLYLPPDEADLVVEYLDLIASDTPSAGQQQRINQLRQTFNSVQSSMDSFVEDLHVEIPSDIPDVSDLPEEVVEGLESVSEYVVSPILNNSTITIIISSVFIFTVIKLLLFGSGPS